MKYHISPQESEYLKQNLVQLVGCSKEDTPDYLIGVKNKCIVKITPPNVETSPSGSATLVAGTVTVANTTITASSRILVTVTTPGGTRGYLSVSKNPGVGFTINSTSNTETSTVDWVINS